jgi:antirestriction protein
MNITLYGVTQFDAAEQFDPFTIELDGLTRQQYLQKASQGLYRHSTSGSVISSKCKKCGHVMIGDVPYVCTECGSEQFNYKETSQFWAICDSEGIPEQYLDNYDLKPEFWEYKELKDASTLNAPALDDIRFQIDDSITALDVENSYRVEYVSMDEEAELIEEFEADYENDYPDIEQDWPVEHDYRRRKQPIPVEDMGGYNF